jgi:hypothetical protein
MSRSISDLLTSPYSSIAAPPLPRPAAAGATPGPAPTPPARPTVQSRVDIDVETLPGGSKSILNLHVRACVGEETIRRIVDAARAKAEGLIGPAPHLPQPEELVELTEKIKEGREILRLLDAVLAGDWEVLEQARRVLEMKPAMSHMEMVASLREYRPTLVGHLDGLQRRAQILRDRYQAEEFALTRQHQIEVRRRVEAAANEAVAEIVAHLMEHLPEELLSRLLAAKMAHQRMTS